MAVRIRKLAKEVRRTPEEVLGVLHALGFGRFRSVEDQVSGPVEAKLRQGLADGVAPLPVEVPDRSSGSSGPAETTLEAMGEGRPDLMATLVPGVTRQGARVPSARSPARAAPPRSRPPQVASPATPPPRPAPSAPPVDVDGEHAALAAERAALESQRRALASERAVFEARQRELEDLRLRLDGRSRALEARDHALQQLDTALTAERAALEAERAAQAGGQAATGSASAGAVPLLDLLEARGLRGADEFDRALVALAGGRHLRDVLWALQVVPADVLTGVVDDKLLLTSGPVPEALGRGAAVVQVAPERADVPGGAALQRALDDLAGALLLHGHRRLLVVGGLPRWQRLLREGLDPRLEVRAVPGGPRAQGAAHDDVAWADVLVLWDVVPTAEADAVYRTAKVLVVRPEGPALRDLLGAITDGLLTA